MSLVEVIIINWKRPKNVEMIVQSLRNQTIPCTITVCDCHNQSEFSLNDATKSKIDRLFSWKHNLGAFSRYIPIPSFDHMYTFFLDDDLLPGTKCLEGFLEAANSLENFGVLGQLGRIIDSDGIYRPKDIARTNDFIEIDFVIRAYFTKTMYLHNIIKFKWMINDFGELLLEDDLLLCASMNYLERLSCYLIPLNNDPEYLINKEELSTEYALSKRIDHRQRRIQFVKKLIEFGWISVSKKSSIHV